MTLRISSNFYSVSIEVLSIASSGDIRHRLRADQGVGGEAAFRQWFHFRLHSAAGQDVRMVFENAAAAAYPDGWPGYRCVASYDRRHWFRIGTTRYEDTIVLQLAHTITETSHPVPNENGTIENAWAIHQMHTTANFSRSNKWLLWYVGGLNFQVEHHLFPTICHVHYPELAPIVKQTAEEFGIRYLANKTLALAISSHIHELKRFGLPNINSSH